jgi:hypothetical protein
MGSITGLSTSDYALGTLPVPPLAQPTVPDFGWAILLAAAVAVISFGALRIGLAVSVRASTRPFLVLPAAALSVAGLAIAFHAASGRDVTQVLFSGQDALPGLVGGADAWSISALLLLLAFKGLAWGASLGSFRGGPTFPALFIGAAAGVLASHLPGFDLTGAVGVGMGAGVVSVLRLPLSAVVLASLLVSKSGPGAGPLIIVGVVVAYLVTMALRDAFGPGPGADPHPEVSPSAA